MLKSIWIKEMYLTNLSERNESNKITGRIPKILQIMRVLYNKRGFLLGTYRMHTKCIPNIYIHVLIHSYKFFNDWNLAYIQ